jgi:hypothetical protein
MGLADTAPHVIYTHLEPSYVGLNGVLSHSEQYLAGPRARRRVWRTHASW